MFIVFQRAKIQNIIDKSKNFIRIGFFFNSPLLFSVNPRGIMIENAWDM